MAENLNPGVNISRMELEPRGKYLNGMEIFIAVRYQLRTVTHGCRENQTGLWRWSGQKPHFLCGQRPILGNFRSTQLSEWRNVL